MRYIYLSPAPIDPKAESGLIEFNRHWPGEIIALAPQSKRNDYPFEVITLIDATTQIRSLKPDVIGALHRPEYSFLTDLPVKTVLTSELDRTIRLEQLRIDTRSSYRRLRTYVGQTRHERIYVAMAKRAAALQCNGPLTFKSYARYNPRTIEFNDHRISVQDLSVARTRTKWNGTSPLRVAFSGKVNERKGADIVVEVAKRLPGLRFDVFGDGPLLRTLRSASPPNVNFHGFVGFSSWKDYFRMSVDIALLPHRQGDPSCTYFEAMGCGVPVIGLQNSTWRHLVKESNFGWAERGVDDIAKTLESLTPTELDSKRTESFAHLVPFEATMKARVEQVLDLFN